MPWGKQTESVLTELCKAYRGGPDKQEGSYIKSSLDPDFCFVPSKGWASAGQLGIDLIFPVVLGSSPSENWHQFFYPFALLASLSPGAGTTCSTFSFMSGKEEAPYVGKWNFYPNHQQMSPKWCCNSCVSSSLWFLSAGWEAAPPVLTCHTGESSGRAPGTGLTVFKDIFYFEYRMKVFIYPQLMCACSHGAGSSTQDGATPSGHWSCVCGITVNHWGKNLNGTSSKFGLGKLWFKAAAESQKYCVLAQPRSLSAFQDNFIWESQGCQSPRFQRNSAHKPNRWSWGSPADPNLLNSASDQLCWLFWQSAKPNPEHLQAELSLQWGPVLTTTTHLKPQSRRELENSHHSQHIQERQQPWDVLQSDFCQITRAIYYLYFSNTHRLQAGTCTVPVQQHPNIEQDSSTAQSFTPSRASPSPLPWQKSLQPQTGEELLLLWPEIAQYKVFSFFQCF